MAGNDDAFAFVLASARRTLGQVADDSRVASPVEGRGAALSAHVQRMIDLIRVQVTAAESAFAGATLPTAQEAVIRNLRLYTQLARALHEALPWLERSTSASLDLGTSYFVDEMALAIVGRDIETVSVPNSSYMYSTLSWPFRLTALRYLSVDIATGTRPIVLFFPLQEADSVLYHAIAAHELGHSAVDQHGLVGEVLAPIQSDATFLTGLGGASAFLQSSQGFDPTAAERVARAQLAGWIEELLCDALALHYLGPSYLFAFSAFVLASSWTDPQPTHPPPTLRVGMLLDQLAHLGWNDWLTGARPHLRDWFEWVKNTALPPMSPNHTFLKDVACERAEAIRTTSERRIGSATFTPDQYIAQEADLQSLLERRILPAELEDAAVDRRNILLAGWMYSLKQAPDGSERADGPSALPEALADPAFQRFLGKALELSTVAETWAGLP